MVFGVFWCLVQQMLEREMIYYNWGLIFTFDVSPWPTKSFEGNRVKQRIIYIQEEKQIFQNTFFINWTSCPHAKACCYEGLNRSRTPCMLNASGTISQGLFIPSRILLLPPLASKPLRIPQINRLLFMSTDFLAAALCKDHFKALAKWQVLLPHLTLVWKK